jgi:hypothetical protein
MARERSNSRMPDGNATERDHEFESGIELNRGFYQDVVKPIVAPPHSAALLGYGSQVLGYDTARSMDHGWGLRVTVFVADADVGATRAAVDAKLPESFAGHPVRYAWDDWPFQHHVEVDTLSSWLHGQLGFDAAAPATTLDWLATPQQKLIEVVRGAVYHDGLNALEQVRAGLTWYPDDVWRWMLGCQWLRIGQEEHFVGRTAEVDDELGSRLLTGRLVRDLMNLHFLYARTYRPYIKWFGTAYATLDGARDLQPIWAAALAANNVSDREGALCAGYAALARMHNAAGLTELIDATVRPFHNRPFLVIDANRFADALFASVPDPWLRAQPRIGSVDQFVDTTDGLQNQWITERFGAVFNPKSSRP